MNVFLKINCSLEIHQNQINSSGAHGLDP